MTKCLFFGKSFNSNIMEHVDEIISEVTAKDSHVLCREVMSITDTMDVMRSKWTVVTTGP